MLFILAGARLPVQLDSTAVRHDLWEMCEALEDDHGGQMKIEDVLREAARFAPIDPRHTIVGFSASAYWLRCRVQSSATTPSDWVLEFRTNPSHAKLYLPDEAGRFTVRSSGLVLRFDQRPFPVTDIALPLFVPPSTALTFYVRLESEDTLDFEGALQPLVVFLERTVTRRLLDGIYYGMLLAIIVYNGFIFLTTRDRTYLTYVAFQLLVVLTEASLEKYTFQYLWPAHPVWALRSAQVFGALAMATGLCFAVEFLQVRAVSQALARGAFVLVGSILLVAAVSPFTYSRAFNSIESTVLLIGILAVFGLSLAAIRVGQDQAWLFLLAMLLLMGGASASILGGVGYLQQAEPLGPLKVGSAAEALLLTLSLAWRIRVLRDQRERALATILEERQTRIAGLGRIVASVAHEIRNPLNFAVGGTAELRSRVDALGTGPLDQRALAAARRAMDLVVAGQQRILDIVDNLRDLGRGVRGEVQAVDVVQELEATLALAREKLEQVRIVVRKELHAAPSIQARPGELQQVFTNLILNSIKAMKDGGTLALTVHEVDREVMVEVQDTGPGIREEHRGLIFEPFFTEPPGEGIGLGLYVSHEIVTRNGGRLTLEPSEGGARFVVTLPAHPLTSARS